jgi:FKBP-type peptidyl-prolyl cis-trans isomerase
MTIRRSIGLAAAIGFLGAAHGPARAAEPAVETEDQKTFYAMGYSLARSIDNFALQPGELDLLIAGLRDGVAGAEPKADPEAYGQKIVAMGQAREKQASGEFLAKEAAAEGAQKLDSGLVKRVITPGSGETPDATDTVKVHYHGTLRDGSVFDSSVERGQPAEFPLNRVIPCWTEALQTMKVGEKAHITCPSDIACGDRGFPPRIKGGAALAFDVELLEIVETPAGAPGSMQQE